MRNMGKKSAYDLANKYIESPFTDVITVIVIPHKFKQP